MYGMDPRFHRRWVEVRRQEGRRRLRVLVGVVTVTVLVVGGWAATRSPLLDVDRILVVGAAHTSADQARAASGIRRGQPLVDVDLPAATRAVERLAWVERARVSRRWPDRVVIAVTERRPVAVIPVAGPAFGLVDATGRVLDVTASPPAGLVALSGLTDPGPPGSALAAEASQALAVARSLPPGLASRTAAVTPAPGRPGEVELRLVPDGVVRVGPAQDLASKFTAIFTVLAGVDLRNLAVLDVRSPSSPVLTRRDATTKVSTPRAG